MKQFLYLNEDGSYRTPELKPDVIARMLPTLTFYLRALKCVLRASKLSRQGNYGEAGWARDSYGTMRAIESVGVKLNIEGAGVLGKIDGPCVIVANHMSTLETFVFPSLVLHYKPVTFVIKKSLVEYPIFGHIIKAAEPIVVGRTNPREDLKAVLEGGVKSLNEGRSVVIFPQTTRKLVFDPANFNTIGIKLAKRAGVPVVPVALKTDAWASGKLVKDFGPVDLSKEAHFKFGKPMTIEGRGSEEHQAIVEFIRTTLLGWGAEVKD